MMADHSAIFEFFYMLTNVERGYGYLYIVSWLLQWLIILTPPFMEILENIKPDYMLTFFKQFSILSYISDLFLLEVIVYSFNTIMLIVMAFMCYSLFQCRSNFYPDQQQTLKFRIFHAFFIASGTFLLPLNTDLIAFCIKPFISQEPYPSYRSISLKIEPHSSSTYLLISLLALDFAFNLFLAIINALFCQDRSVLGRFFWTPTRPYCEIVMIIIHILTRCYFIFIPDVFL